jgi:hypothetical protein
VHRFEWRRVSQADRKDVHCTLTPAITLGHGAKRIDATIGAV